MSHYTCQTHPRRFDLDELGNLAVNAPAILVSCSGFGKTQSPGTGEQKRAVRFTAFILTADAGALRRDEAAINLAEGLVTYLPEQTFGLDYVYPVDASEIAQAQNLYSSNVGKRGVALWAVVWDQHVVLGNDMWSETTTGQMPAHLYVGVSPEIGAAHEAGYVDLSGGDGNG